MRMKNATERERKRKKCFKGKMRGRWKGKRKKKERKGFEGKRREKRNVEREETMQDNEKKELRPFTVSISILKPLSFAVTFEETSVETFVSTLLRQ